MQCRSGLYAFPPTQKVGDGWVGERDSFERREVYIRTEVVYAVSSLERRRFCSVYAPSNPAGKHDWKCNSLMTVERDAWGSRVISKHKSLDSRLRNNTMGRCPFHSGPLSVDRHSSSAECVVEAGCLLTPPLFWIMDAVSVEVLYLCTCIILFWWKSGHLVIVICGILTGLVVVSSQTKSGSAKSCKVQRKSQGRPFYDTAR